MNLNCLVLCLIIPVVISRDICRPEIDTEQFSTNFIKHFEEYLISNTEDEKLKEARSMLLSGSDKNFILMGFPEKTNAKVCLKCLSTISAILWYNNTHGFEDNELSKTFLKKLCNYVEIEKGLICDGNVELYYDTIKYILKNKQNTTANEVCGILLQGFYCLQQETPYKSITVEKPIIIGSKKHFSESTGMLKILHFSDFHFDPKYVEGSNTQCQEWICCRGSRLPLNNPARAGKWGDYRKCDSPSYQVENLVKEAALRHKDISLIYITGDFADHFGWHRTAEELMHSLEYVTDLIKRYFPGVPVVPVLGNHDSHPDNLFSPSYVQNKELSSAWFYDFLANIWQDWLSKDAIETFRIGGYYTALLRPNFRIIALNNNVCFAANLWLLLDDFYFREQLEWLNRILKNASLANEKVHIISHVPSNDIHCYRVWTKEFKRIIESYTHIISAQFNGHSHLDEFVVYYAEDDPSAALSVAWNGGSGTNFPNVNSNYKVLYVNDQTYEVQDFETWIFNLTEANAHDNKDPQWYKEYNFKSFFNLTDLSPDSINTLVKKMAVDENLLEKYWRIKIKQSDSALESGCDSTCLSSVWSDITRTYFNNEKSIRNHNV